METKNTYQKPVEIGQDIYDLCIQEYGSIEAVFLLLEDNPEIDLQTTLQSGQVLNFRVELPIELPRKTTEIQYFRNTKTRVRCGGGESLDDNDNVQGGILTTTNNVLLTAPDAQPIVVSAEQPEPALPEDTLVDSNGNHFLQAGTAQLMLASVEAQLLTASNTPIKTGNGLSVFATIKPDKILTAASGLPIILSNGNYLKIK